MVKDAKDKANDPNHELNEILRHVGKWVLLTWQAFKILRNINLSLFIQRESKLRGGVVKMVLNDWWFLDNSKTNPLFIRTQDARKLKNIMRKILIQRKQAEKCKSQRWEEITESNHESFLKTVDKMVKQKWRNRLSNPYRKNLFTPDSALSTLPALQITTVVPNENEPEGKRRYRRAARLKSKLEKHRLKLNSPVKPLKLNKNWGKLNISISSKIDSQIETPLRQDASTFKNEKDSYRK